jgi:hypothetical protein
LILFDKMVACVFGDALDADVFLVGFTEEAKGLIMIWAELVILSELLFLTGQLQGDVVFCKICGLNLGAMLVATGGTIEHFLFFVYYEEALLTNSVTAVEVAGNLFLGVVQVITHGALHG